MPIAMSRRRKHADTAGPTPETEADRRLVRDIATRGWHVVDVPEQNERPSWAFTVGLEVSFGHSEVVVFGLPGSSNCEVLERVATGIATGRSHRAGTATEAILPGLRCEFRTVAAIWHDPLLGYAVWYYDGLPFSTVQFCWPDRAGRLPGAIAFDPDIANLQPQLEHASAREAGIEALLHALDIR
jgi:hypothetical protein